jgi:membrane-bound serine protease (ClpP class)
VRRIDVRGVDVRRLMVVVLLSLGVVAAAAPAAGADAGGRLARQTAPVEGGYVDIVEVTGLLDPVLADLMRRSIGEAEAGGALAVVFRVDSSRAVISDDEVRALGERIRESEVLVSFWVGQSGARVERGVAQLALLGDDLGISVGSRLGNLGELLFPIEDLGGDAALQLVDRTLGRQDLVALGLAREANILGQHLIGIPGFDSEIVEDDDGNQTIEARTQTRFKELPLGQQLFHTVASPPVAYLLLLIGLGLLLFELYTAGVGIAGVVGAVCMILAAYGLEVLPTRWWALALLLLSAFGFAVDIQAGVPRFWTGFALVALVLGSLFLFEGVELSWLTLLVGIGGMAIAMVSGMPAMVRTRFSTPTIGREWMIGELGEAVEDVQPDGVVRVRDALWRARTNRATPIPAGEPVRVIAIEGLVLEVEPEEGGARDYRERGGDVA